MGLIKSTVITLALALLAGGAMAQRMSPENVARLGKRISILSAGSRRAVRTG